MALTRKYPFISASQELKSQVWWRGGRPIPDFDPAIWRYDMCGNIMKFSDHGNRDSKYGWEIDHIYPESRGGSNELSNLQPLQWENNVRKGDTYPWSCGS